MSCCHSLWQWRMVPKLERHPCKLFPSFCMPFKTIAAVDKEHQSVTLLQPQVEWLLEPWLYCAKRLIPNALEEFHKYHAADSSFPKVEEVILVGGTTRIPAIQKRIQSLFPNIKLCASLNPMSSVAQGMAIQAASSHARGCMWSLA